MNELAEVTPAAAVRAVVAAADDGRIAGHYGDQPLSWRLSAAIVMVGHWPSMIVWTDNLGLALVDDLGQVVYRFATAQPADLTPPVPKRRAALWLVGDNAFPTAS